MVNFQMLALRRYLRKGEGEGQPPSEVVNDEIPQGSLICDFACHLTKNTDTLYLKVLGIP